MADFLNDYVLSPTLSISSFALTSIPVLRRWFFGKEDGSDVNLPPVCHFGTTVTKIRKHGVWGRHIIDQELANEIGHVYCMIPPPAMGGGLVKLVVNVSAPNLVEEVLTNTATFPTRGKTGLGDTVGLGLVELPTGERHSFHREIIGSMLTHTHLIQYAETVRAETNVLLSKWKVAAAEKIVINAHYDLTMCTQEIIGQIGLGQSNIGGGQQVLEKDNTNYVETAFMMRRAAISTAVGKTVLKMFSSTKDNEQEASIRKNGYAETVEHVRVALASSNPNMVKSMKNANDDGESFTNQEIIDEFITIRGAGHETTSNTLSWCVMLLAKHTAVQDALYEEIQSVLGDRSTPSFADTEHLILTKSVIYEALRMYPTVPSFPRLSVADTKLGEYDIPSGTLVFVSQSAMNRRKDIWGDDADVFNPSRFRRKGYSLDLVQSLPKGVPGGELYGFAPFGAGKRTCPGQRLALVEMVIMLAGIISSFDIKLAVASIDEIVKNSDITLGPKLGLPIYCTQREGREEQTNTLKPHYGIDSKL
jgi:cytochrome P450